MLSHFSTLCMKRLSPLLINSILSVNIIHAFFMFRKLAQTGHQKEELDKQRKILQKRKPPSEKILGKSILSIRK